MNQSIVQAIVFPVFMVMAAIVLSSAMGLMHRTRRLQMLSEMHQRLFDRLGSVQEFTEFVRTDAGRQFLQALSSEEAALPARDRVLRAAERGIVVACVGIGLVLVGRWFTFEARDALSAIGLVALSVGVGYGVSAVVLQRLAASKEPW